MSYRSNEIHCPREEVLDAIPFFATYDTSTFHSVPLQYTVDTICPNNNAKNAKDPVRGLSHISGIGRIHINANCFLKLPDDRTIESHHLPEKSTDLGVSSITDALINIIQPDTYLIPWTNNSYWADKPELPDLILNPSPYNITDFLQYTFDPQQFSSHTVRTSVIMIVVCLLFGICCFFSRPCFRWAKTFFLISNPRKYWTETKNLYVPYFTKMHQPARNGSSFLDRHKIIGRMFNIRPRNNNPPQDPTVHFNKQDEEVRIFLNTQRSSPTIVRHTTLSRTETPIFANHNSHYDFNPVIVNANPSREVSYTPRNPPQDEACGRQTDPEEWDMQLYRTSQRLKAAGARSQYEGTQI